MCSVKPPNDLSHKGRSVEEWVDLHFFRPIGIRIARALQPTGISADQVTLWSLMIGLVAGHLFAYRDRWTNLIGFALFIVSDVFDSADGQLARLRGTSTRFGRALDGINDNLRFDNRYFHLMYRLIASGFWWPGACLLVAAAGLAHTFQSAAIDFVRNAYLYIGVGGRGELDLPEDLDPAPRGSWLERFGARVYRDYIVRQVQLLPRPVQPIRALRQGGASRGSLVSPPCVAPPRYAPASTSSRSWTALPAYRRWTGSRCCAITRRCASSLRSTSSTSALRPPPISSSPCGDWSRGTTWCARSRWRSRAERPSGSPRRRGRAAAS